MKTIAPAPPAVGVQQQDGEQVAPDVIAGKCRFFIKYEIYHISHI